MRLGKYFIKRIWRTGLLLLIFRPCTSVDNFTICMISLPLTYICYHYFKFIATISQINVSLRLFKMYSSACETFGIFLHIFCELWRVPHVEQKYTLIPEHLFSLPFTPIHCIYIYIYITECYSIYNYIHGSTTYLVFLPGIGWMLCLWTYFITQISQINAGISLNRITKMYYWLIQKLML